MDGEGEERGFARELLGSLGDVANRRGEGAKEVCRENAPVSLQIGRVRQALHYQGYIH